MNNLSSNFDSMQLSRSGPILCLALAVIVPTIYPLCADAQDVAPVPNGNGEHYFENSKIVLSPFPIVLPGVAVPIVVDAGWSSSCSLITDGTFTITHAPKHGTFSSNVATFALSPDAPSCQGSLLPQNVGYYTWTDTNPNESTDTITIKWKGARGETVSDQQVDITRGPRILFNQEDVTYQTTPVAAGQQIAPQVDSYSYTLTTIPFQVSIVGQYWSAEGSTVGTYAPVAGAPCTVDSGCLTQADLTNPTPTFYWTDVDPSGAVNRKLAYNFTALTTEPDGTTVSSNGSITATFKVESPSGISVTSSTALPVILDGDPLQQLSFGTNSSAATAGFSAQVSSTPPADVGPGKIEFAQIISQDSLNITSNGTSQTCNLGAGLDNIFPIATAGPSVLDAPNVAITDAYPVSQLSRSFAAKMYVLWDSQTASSIPVPLGYNAWAYSATAVPGESGGNCSGDWCATGGGPLSSFTLSPEFPQWVQTVTNVNVSTQKGASLCAPYMH